MLCRLRHKVLFGTISFFVICYLQLMNILELELADPVNNDVTGFFKDVRFGRNNFPQLSGIRKSISVNVDSFRFDNNDEKYAKGRKRTSSSVLNFQKFKKEDLLEEIPSHIKNAITSTRKRNSYLFHLHHKILNFTSEKEILKFYARDKKSGDIFRTPIDIKNITSYVNYLFPSESSKDSNDRILNQLNLKLYNTSTKTILFYHPMGFTQKDFEKKNCNVKDCIITSDRSKLRESNAIIFRSIISFQQRLPDTSQQIWIWTSLESGANSPKVSLIPSVVNWTETYRQDSTIVSPYERFTPYANIHHLPKNANRNFAANKTRKVAWFVSNCHAKNKRMAYVKELMKFISVDIYGRCGTFSCPRTDKKCFKKLREEYKFYLAFENTNCKDYISEKLYWNAYGNDILPIVMGAHPNDYKSVVPPRSFIHVDMFESPKQLAKYLHFLDKNDDLYNSFFLWKNTGEYIDTKSICRICAMVHVGEYVTRHYENVNEWWSGRNVCRRANGESYAASWKNKNDSPKL